MFLKRLETVGFKSFAERTTIEFVAGVTAVVGPNGSGKSNVIDAVRWVLGEQSARTLRGQKMEDIIFQGSDTRNQLNFAEVTLVLNNEAKKLPIDYNEVSITRRVYRSGDSDFLINKQACRLKDIVDLFMDTGLGRESFSIIGQGKIDEILSSKAEERRAIFEEAAGVLKYKQRKNRAQFKLEETNENLSRVEDIIYEIEQQAEPLKAQAMTAQEYKAQRTELKKIEIALLITEIEELNDEWRGLLRIIEDAQLAEVREKTRLQEREAIVFKNQQKLANLEKTINETQESLLKTTEALEQLEGKRNVYNERVKHLSENKTKLSADLTAVKSRKQLMEGNAEAEQELLTEITGQIKVLKNGISQLENELVHGHDLLKEEIEDLKSDYIEYLNEQAVLQNEQHSLSRQLEQLKQVYESEQNSNDSFIQEKAALFEKKIKLETEINEQTTRINQAEEKSLKLKASLARERENYEQMQRNLYAGNEQIAKITSRLEMLEEMKQSYQGYFYGVKEVLKAAENGILSDINGAVVDLITVPNKYITAIDTILGAQVQHIVVPNDEVARETIHWLRRENKGRATFLPLASIEARTIPQNVIQAVKQHTGFIGIAANVLQTEVKFEKVLQHLMGNVILVDNLHSANEIAAIVSRRYRIVTLDGDIVFPGGSMSGGAKKQTKQSLFTREKELTNLQEKQAEYGRRAKEYIKKLEQQRVLLTELEEKIVIVDEEINQLKTTLQSVNEIHHTTRVTLGNLETDLSVYNLNMKEYKEKFANLHEQKESNAAKDAKMKEIIAVTEKEINIKTNEEKHIADNERKVQATLHEQQIRLAEQEERKKSQQDKINLIQTQLTELTMEESQLIEEMTALDNVKEFTAAEESFSIEIKKHRTKRDELLKMLTDSQQLREESAQLLVDEDREIKEQYKLHEKMIRNIQENEVKANRLDVALENRLSHLQTEYVMTYERAIDLYEKVVDVVSARNDVKQIKEAIKRLGTVNLGAIEEYDRIMERFNFLTEQKTDLLAAKETLYAAIKEMDEEMIERFTDVFTNVQIAFTETFRRLFDGGHAELVLTSPNDMLETGIEIIAQPPGKKMKSLGLLSGGERALTAIALLFAILKVKPVPFCILDEVDAALDEANVKRFSNYLKLYSEGTQFIVITHRNGTMEEADILYGVTMQESGVSRLVSVRLEEMKDLVELT